MNTQAQYKDPFNGWSTLLFIAIVIAIIYALTSCGRSQVKETPEGPMYFMVVSENENGTSDTSKIVSAQP